LAGDKTPSHTASSETAGVVLKNIQSLFAIRHERERQRSTQQRLADIVARFVGNMKFVYLLATLVTAWIVVNLRWVPDVPRFDPYPFPLLSELNVQVSLLAEHEVTQLIHLVEAISIRVGAQGGADPKLDEFKQNVDPLALIEEIDKANVDAATS
jgi:uncharacterized membrane protein